MVFLVCIIISLSLPPVDSDFGFWGTLAFSTFLGPKLKNGKLVCRAQRKKWVCILEGNVAFPSQSWALANQAAYIEVALKDGL